MSSDKMSQVKETAVGKAEETKQFGEEKAGDAQKQFDSANKEAEKQMDAANKSDDPGFADQAKEKAGQAKTAAADAQGKVSNNLYSMHHRLQVSVHSPNCVKTDDDARSVP